MDASRISSALTSRDEYSGNGISTCNAEFLSTSLNSAELVEEEILDEGSGTMVSRLAAVPINTSPVVVSTAILH